MKNLIFVFVFFASCADSRFEPTIADDMNGEWTRKGDPNRHYLFGEGYVTTWIYNFSTVIAPKWYSIEEVGDRTLMLVEKNSQDTAFWRFGETDGQAVTVTDTGGEIDFSFNLKRAE